MSALACFAQPADGPTNNRGDLAGTTDSNVWGGSSGSTYTFSIKAIEARNNGASPR